MAKGPGPSPDYLRALLRHGFLVMSVAMLAGAESEGRGRGNHRWISDIDEILHGRTNHRFDGVALPEEFIYVYDIGSEYNVDLMERESAWWSSQYEGELQVYKMLAEENIGRTFDPEKATLFYIPFFSTRYAHVIFKDHINYSDNREWNRISVMFNLTSSAYGEILKKIRSQSPYFDRNRGRDHFSVLTHDHGRCSALTFIDPNLYEEMFFLTLNGDKMVRSTHAITAREMQVLTYDWSKQGNCQIPDIPCYMADRDIVVPPGPIHLAEEKSSPWEHERNVTALFRFSAVMDHNVLIPFWHHYVRTELYKIWKEKHVEGFDFGVKSEAESEGDWERAKFCVCPPGHSQWTSRFPKAILAGCIPVTFFQEHDNPWQDDIDYELFTVNINVDDMRSLKHRLDAVLSDVTRLRVMQQELAKVQEFFLWGSGHGVWALSFRALRNRAKKILQKTERINAIFAGKELNSGNRRRLREVENIGPGSGPEKYLYFQRENDQYASYGEIMSSFLCSLKEAETLNRTFVMDTDWWVSTENINGGEKIFQDARLYIDLEKLSNRQGVASKSQFLQDWRKWDKENPQKILSLQALVPPLPSIDELKGCQAAILSHNFILPDSERKFYKFCKDEKKISKLPNELLSPLLLEIVEAISHAIGREFDSVELRRGVLSASPQKWPNLGIDTQPMRLHQSIEKRISAGRTLYIATDERRAGYFKNLREKYVVKTLGDFKHLWQKGSKWWIAAQNILGSGVDPIFDAHMQMMVDYAVWEQGTTRLRTFNDLTSDSEEGVEAGR